MRDYRLRYITFLVTIGLWNLGGCHWDRASEFEHALRCGMTPREVSDLATGMGAPKVVEDQDVGDRYTHRLLKGRTDFRFKFDAGRLRIYERIEVTGLTGTRSTGEIQLCAHPEETKQNLSSSFASCSGRHRSFS
jgi:hypothetical protein